MSKDQASLVDIEAAGKLIVEFVQGLTKEAFIQDAKTRSAVLLQFLILGEAAKRISQAFRDDHPEIPLRQMAGMRDILIHIYESVDLDLVWRTANEDVPALLKKIEPFIPKKD